MGVAPRPSRTSGRTRRARALRRLAVAPLLAAGLLAVGCGGEDTTGLEGADTASGKDLFVSGAEGRQPCGSCHSLADAGTAATVGPDLDDAFRQSRADGFDDSTVFRVTLDQIALAAPPMPADLVTGQDAVDVAAYIASVAGKPPPEQGGAAAGTTTTAP
jgi:mono/diheme cytochrome c family protein